MSRNAFPGLNEEYNMAEDYRAELRARRDAVTKLLSRKVSAAWVGDSLAITTEEEKEYNGVRQTISRTSVIHASPEEITEMMATIGFVPKAP
jgi:hypothetical protein